MEVPSWAQSIFVSPAWMARPWAGSWACVLSRARSLPAAPEAGVWDRISLVRVSLLPCHAQPGLRRGSSGCCSPWAQAGPPDGASPGCG